MAPLASETEAGEELHRPVLTDGELPGGAAGTDVLVRPGHIAWCPRMADGSPEHARWHAWRRHRRGSPTLSRHRPRRGKARSAGVSRGTGRPGARATEEEKGVVAWLAMQAAAVLPTAKRKAAHAGWTGQLT
jgi:hypothetical protein